MKLVTYAPDLDPIEDGILLECNQVIPTIRGIACAPSPVDTAASTVTATVVGAKSITRVDGATRTFVGTSVNIYEQAGSSWNVVSSLATVNARISFAQYGDVSLAVSKENVLRASSGSGSFTAVASTATGSTVTAPAAAIVETCNDFVFLLNTTDVPGYSGDQPDRWVCSALGDYADWSPDIATQCVTGRLTSSPGAITAGRRFGDQFVIYKERAMYLGSYIGPPIVWAFPELPTADTGTFCNESVVSVGTPEQPLHFFVGRDDFYLFDGARPIPVGHGVKERFFNELNIDEADKIVCLIDRVNSLIRIFYPTNDALNKCLVFNYRTKRWGRDDRSIQYAFEYLTPGVTYADLGTYYSTYNEFPNVPYNEAFRGSRTTEPAIVNSSNVVQTLSGTNSTGTFTTHDFGDDSLITSVSRVQPRWIRRPSSGQMVNRYWMVSGDDPAVDTTTDMDSGRFDVLRSATWHRFDFTLPGQWELNEVKIDAKMDGYE